MEGTSNGEKKKKEIEKKKKHNDRSCTIVYSKMKERKRDNIVQKKEKLKKDATRFSLSLPLSGYTPEEKLMTRAWNDAASAKKYVSDGGERKTMVLFTARNS